MAEPTQKTAAVDPKAAPPAGEAAAGGKKSLIWIVGGAVGLIALVIAVVMMKGGKEHGEGDGSGGSGGIKEMKPEDAVPGKQIKIPDMVFPMSSEREKDFMAFQLQVVLVLRKAARADTDEEVMKRQLEIEDAVEKHIPWIQQEITNMIFRYELEDRDRLLQDVGAQQFAEELKGVVNKRFKQFGVDVVKEVWIPVRRPVTQ